MKLTLIFVQIWRVIFFLTGISFMVGGLILSLPQVAMWIFSNPWIVHFVKNPRGVSFYGGLVMLNPEQFESYTFLCVVAVPILLKGGLHFFLFASRFSYAVYPDLYMRQLMRRKTR